MENMGKEIFEQAISFWIAPEIKKLMESGKISKETEISSAQIIFSIGKRKNKNIVRVNRPIKATVVAKGFVKKNDLVEINPDDIKEINLENIYKDAAHITLLRFGKLWKIYFDFRYNKSKAREHISASKEFLQSAESNLKEGRIRPFFENAYASAELSTMSILLQFPNKRIIFGKRHDERLSALKEWATLGNISIEYSELMDLLTKQRKSARYLAGSYKESDGSKIVETLKKMIESAEKELS